MVSEMKPIRRVMEIRRNEKLYPKIEEAGGGAKLPTEYEADCMVMARHEEPRG